MEHEHAASGRRVDGFGQGAEAHVLRLEKLYCVDELAHRPGQAVEFPDDKRVARSHVVERALKLRSVALRAGCSFNENAFTSGHLKGVRLKRQILFGCRNSGVTNIHSLEIRKCNADSVSDFDAQF